ncbi:MAG: twin-arginine translocase subunit TatC [Sedimentisphaerales bacterium]|nr:twin-arginine translocase subunit TatC [Sedimentisphaerales bacterium]
MSLGDHLEELRVRMLLAIAGLVVATVISLFFGGYIIGFIEKPYFDAYSSKDSESEDIDSVKKHIQAIFSDISEKLADDPNFESISPIFQQYLNRYSSEAIAALVNDPNNNILNSNSDKNALAPRLQSLAPADGITSYIKIALISGLILSSPWIFYQLWMFIAAGLYQHERKYVQTAVPFSTILFVAGSLFFLLVVAPWTLKFFIKFNKAALGVNSNFTFTDYISFITMLMLVFGAAFQTPIAIFILTKTGLVSIQTLCKSRKMVLLVIFVIAAIVTPPDVVSQITLALPIYALYELGILLSWLAERKKKKALVAS